MAPHKRSQRQTNGPQRQFKAHKSQQPTSSTQREATSPPSVNLDEFVKRCVRYMLIKGGSSTLITEADIKKTVLNKPSAPKLKQVMKKAKKILVEVYGFKVQKSINTKTQYYFMYNILPPLDQQEEIKVPVDSNRIMLMLILVHLCMCDNNCTEESLLLFLQKMQMDSCVKHAIFGNIGEYIKSSVKHKYLEMTTHNDKTKYKWGIKSECTFSKEEILNFMSTIFDRPPQKWVKGKNAADEQNEMLHEDSESDVSVESF